MDTSTIAQPALPAQEADTAFVPCEYCGQVMMRHAGCTVTEMQINGTTFARVRFGPPWGTGIPDEACHDCGVAVGQFHHPGCDMDPCPLCGRQQIWCEHTPVATFAPVPLPDPVDAARTAYMGAVDAWLDMSEAAADAFATCESLGLSGPAVYEAARRKWDTACEARRQAADYRDHTLALYAAARQAQKGGC